MLSALRNAGLWLRRLPPLFSLTFIAILAGLLILLSISLGSLGLRAITKMLLQPLGLWVEAQQLPGFLSPFAAIVRVAVESSIALALVAASLIVSYNLAAFVQRNLRRRPREEAHPPVLPRAGSDTTLAQLKTRYQLKELRIGIILAGGGAKGAYQAGALKAIWEFLEANNALDRVRMIAGTSIGSWNALFWLAGLVKPPSPGLPSTHATWWRRICINRIMEFGSYVPGFSNSFFRTGPWQQSFDAIFGSKDVRPAMDAIFGPKPPIHFYFTRSNVEQGHLEFATNNAALAGMKRRIWRGPGKVEEEPFYPADRYEVIPAGDGALERLKLAVFASMDLPPLFPYMRIKVRKEEIFEDGGVIDNLPMRFATEFEDCNLVFVLPLNASFEEEAPMRSVIGRLMRVMNVRQGVLEQWSLKMARLYNERALLISQIPARAMAGADVRVQQVEALRERMSDPACVFAICPAPPLEIGTAEFWKPREAGRAFDVMYDATKSELEEDLAAATDPHRVRIALVSPKGSRTYRSV